MLRDLIQHAGRIGATVHFAPIDNEDDLLGYFLPNRRLIVIRLGMTQAQSRWVLAHECGHAFYGHRCAGSTGSAERQADAYAAQLLIDPNEYARLELINPDRHWLADEFSVHVDAIFAFERYCLTQLRGITYASARMGVDQWSHRAVPV